jgi:hypothetical protein
MENRILEFIPLFFMVLAVFATCFCSLQNPKRRVIELTYIFWILAGTSSFLVFGLIEKSLGSMCVSGGSTILLTMALYAYWKKRPVEY